MYQASIRDKKKHKIFNHAKTDNYELNPDFEEYAYVKKLLGSCRVHVLTASGIDAIGIIRGSMRKFNKRVIIEVGDIVVVSKRDYQNTKVDIVHKYNTDQVQSLINEKKLSNILCNYYNFPKTDTQEDTVDKDDGYIDFGNISDDDNEFDFKSHNPNRKYETTSDDDTSI